jgi:two-component system chemotaxis sensor kinase CheA
MDINKLKEIFIEEASEIIEKLDIDIINFEDNPEDKELLNELFRGVHTLKGSANSFGFSRLGEFVHHFEDVLDYYRNNDESINSKIIDTFLEAVDIIKDVMEIEIDEIDDLPPNYNKCLEAIKTILNKSDDSTFVEEHEIDLSKEFDNELVTTVDLEKLKDELIEEEALYKITLAMDDDVYFRGFDHSKLFKLLSKEGNILESYWDMSDIPAVEEIKIETSYIKRVEVYFASKSDEEAINEIFEYLDDDEYKIEKLFVSQKEIPTLITDVDIKFGKRKEDNIQEVKQRGRRKTDAHSYVKIDTNKLDELFDSIGELVIAQNFLAENRDIKQIKNENVTKTINVLSKITRLIQNRVMSLRMVPINDTFEKMKRVVRDASSKVSKEISLEVEGAETEIDKTMIDSLSDPLIHIIRNAIDHGIEDNSEDRVRLRKSPVGVVTLRAYHKGGKIAIEISDDGRGINKDKVLQKAIERGLVGEDEELSDSQVFGLIMQARFSTADVISDISGRGVGLDVVRTSIEKLKGKVEISSEVGKGSTFTILLPLTLAIIDGMLVRSEDDTFIIPTLSVIESFVPHKNIVHTFKDDGEFVDLRGDMIPIIRLNQLLEISDNKPNAWESILVCVESEKGKFSLLIDDLIGRQQVVIKSLGSALSKIKEVSGSAVMGNGDIALILNVEELLKHEINEN